MNDTYFIPKMLANQMHHLVVVRGIVNDREELCVQVDTSSGGSFSSVHCLFCSILIAGDEGIS